MSESTPRGRARVLAALVATVTTGVVMTGCASNDPVSPAPPGGTEETPAAVDQSAAIEAALQEETTLTFWGWAPQLADMVAAFEAEYPKVDVELQNNGSGGDEYIKLQNAIKAGSGVPDLAQIEYTALPQFAFGESIVDLNEYGLGSLEDKFSKSAWTEIHTQGGLYGMPQDDGPIVMFYRQDIFDELGLEVPETWDDYYEVAKQIREADPTKFIATDTGDAPGVEALIWQAGGTPFEVDETGTQLTINLQDEGSKRFADMQNRLIQEDLIDSVSTFSPEWTTAMAQGTYATWITGAWGAGSLQKRFAEQDSGKWRVAPVPQYEEGESVSAVRGGSATVVLEASDNKLAAVGLAEWLATSPEANQIFADLGGFPTASATLTSEEWLNQELPFFGGQQANQIFAEAAENVPTGWNFLPYEVYAGTVFPDTAGQAYANGTDLNEGLQAWQDALVTYGRQQGFTVNE